MPELDIPVQVIHHAEPIFVTPEGKETRLYCGLGRHNWVHQKHIAALCIQARWFSYILRKVRSPAPAEDSAVAAYVAYAARSSGNLGTHNALLADETAEKRKRT